MVQRIAGPGIGLPLPQNLYPSAQPSAYQFAFAPGTTNQDTGGNRVTLNAGDSFVVPAGEWYVGLGSYLVLEFLDPISNQWTITAAGSWAGGLHWVFSDGYNTRVANVLGCPVAAVVTAAGGTYVQASTTITVTGGGGATYAPIVGGQVAGGIPTGGFGAGYGIPPLALIPAPPPPAANPNGVGGIQASGYFTIASGTISGFTLTNPGAGYPAGFTIVAVPSPFDPNINTGITLGTCTFGTTAGGSLTGVLVTNMGNALATIANYTLTVGGVGTNATVSAVFAQTITAASLTGTGTLAGTTSALMTTYGGYYPTSVFTTAPENLYLAGRPRPATMVVAITGTGTVSAQAATLYDSGFFYQAPLAMLSPNAANSGAFSGSMVGPTVALTMGSKPDIALLQPAS
jgi:hypothetical protein